MCFLFFFLFFFFLVRERTGRVFFFPCIPECVDIEVQLSDYVCDTGRVFILVLPQSFYLILLLFISSNPLLTIYIPLIRQALSEKLSAIIEWSLLLPAFNYPCNTSRWFWLLYEKCVFCVFWFEKSFIEVEKGTQCHLVIIFKESEDEII